MKYFFSALLIGLMFSCTTEQDHDRSFLDYIMIPGSGDQSIREFQRRSDTTMAVMLLREYHKTLPDSSVEFNFTWTTNEDAPLQRSVERYTKNTIEFVSGGNFELDSLRKLTERPMNFTGDRTLGIGKSKNTINFNYTYETEPKVKITVKSDWNFNFQPVDSLGEVGKDCLVMTSSESILFESADTSYSKQNTTLRIYARDRGLIRFGSTESNGIGWFKLRDN